MAELNENSATVFQMGANLMTSALPQEHKADMQMLGQGVSQILRNRFMTQQAEDFKQNELAAFQEASAQFGTNLSMIEDPNQQVQALMDYKNSVMMPFITNTSMKYANNEVIMNTAKTVFQMGPQLKDYLDAGNMQNQTAQVAIDERNAATAEKNATTAAQQARTQSGLLAHQLEMDSPINANMPAAKLTERLNNLPLQEREAIDNASMDMYAAAEAKVREGSYDPQRKTQFGKNFLSMKDDAGNIIMGDRDRQRAILEANPDLSARIKFFGRSVEKIGLEATLQKYPGQFTDIASRWTGKTEEPQEIQMKGSVPDDVIIGVFKNQVQSNDELTVDQFKNSIKMMTSPRELGDRFYAEMESAVRKEGQVLFLGGSNQRLGFSTTDWKANRQLLTKILEDQFKDRIINKLASNDKSSLTTRRKLEEIGAVAIEQFIDDYGDDLDILVKNPRASAGRSAREIPGRRNEDASVGLLSSPRSSGGIF